MYITVKISSADLSKSKTKLKLHSNFLFLIKDIFCTSVIFCHLIKGDMNSKQFSYLGYVRVISHF